MLLCHHLLLLSEDSSSSNNNNNNNLFPRLRRRRRRRRTTISYKRNQNSRSYSKRPKYNEALLKHEQNEIDSLAKYIKEIEAAEKDPYEEEFTNEKLREARRKLETSSRKVKECFEEDRRDGEGSSLATRCRAVVLEYEKCGQEALEAFVAARS